MFTPAGGRKGKAEPLASGLSAQAGFDTSDRLEDYRRGPESEALMRSLVSDGLRHLADAPGSAPTFHIEHRGRSSDVLTFVTRGVTSPLGAGSLWKMTLSPTTTGLEIRAEAVEDSTLTPVKAVVRGISGMVVRVTPSNGDSGWTSEWNSENQIPAAVLVSFSSRRGSVVPPILVSVSSDSYR